MNWLDPSDPFELRQPHVLHVWTWIGPSKHCLPGLASAVFTDACRTDQWVGSRGWTGSRVKGWIGAWELWYTASRIIVAYLILRSFQIEKIRLLVISWLVFGTAVWASTPFSPKRMCWCRWTCDQPFLKIFSCDWVASMGNFHCPSHHIATYMLTHIARAKLGFLDEIHWQQNRLFQINIGLKYNFNGCMGT